MRRHLSVGDVLIVIQDLSRSRCLQKVDTAQQCGFTGTGGAYDARHIALSHREIDIPEHHVRSERLAK